MTPADPERRARASLQEEVDSAALYRGLADAEEDPLVSEVYRRLAATEEKHAAFWEERLRAAGHGVPPRRPGWRTRTLVSLARRFGAQLVLPTVIGGEEGGRRGYRAQGEAPLDAMAAEESSHGRVLRALSGPRDSGTADSGAEGSTIARLEGRHRAVGGNALRAAVLGANDGLVSNLSLVMGVVGADLSGRSILITGLAGLLAGAGSMAMGEWLSVQSSRELYQRQIEVEREEIAAIPEDEAEELALIYQAKGLPAEQAKTLAASLISDPRIALDTMAREELGIDPAELGGSAWEAAAFSFVLFGIGAVVPVAPFLFSSGTSAILLSLGASALALFLIGAGITLLTGRRVLYSGMRQLLIGLGAAGLTFGIGRLIGVSIGG